MSRSHVERNRTVKSEQTEKLIEFKDNKERLIQRLSEKTGAKSSALEMIKSESKSHEKILPKETSKIQQTEIKNEKHITPSKDGFSMEM